MNADKAMAGTIAAAIARLPPHLFEQPEAIPIGHRDVGNEERGCAASQLSAMSRASLARRRESSSVTEAPWDIVEQDS